MNTSFELNNAVYDSVDSKYRTNSPVVEVFSALVSGKDTSRFKDGVVDKSVKYIGELASRAIAGDQMAVSEINNIMRLSIQPALLNELKILDFMGTYRKIPYSTVPMMTTYKYESVESRFQASSGDVPFGAMSWSEYPISTQTISGGFAVDYRELQNGNFEGNVAEGMRQVLIDMGNKVVYYVLAKLYDGIKNATGVKHFSESAGITQSAVDDMLKVMRAYGKITITGDYAVVSQLNDFDGYKVLRANATDGSEIINHIPFGADAVASDIRNTGIVNLYKGANVVELPNAYNYTELNATKDNFELYLPQGLLLFLPVGSKAPVQIIQRGDITTMTGSDIVTRQHMTRFDLEIGAGIARGMEHTVGLLSDANYARPSVA